MEGFVSVELREAVRIDEHPFYRDVLSLSSSGGNPILGQVRDAGYETQANFLMLVAQAYAAFSSASPLAFRRVRDLTQESSTREIAQRLYDIEMGRAPLVGAGGPSHLEQFRRMFESLLPGLCLERPAHDSYPVHEALALNRASLVDALATCEEIETCGRGVINALQDFVAQWQVLNGIPSSKIERSFLDEHSLVEGGTGDDQHMGMLDRMMEPYAELRSSEDYRLARQRVCSAFALHHDEAIAQISALPALRAGAGRGR